jgi:phenylacetyl-CoA:acceptor oxidoreductase subunit 2
LLAFAAAAHLAGMDVAVSVTLGIALIAAGLTCVWLEIGRPWRALNVVRHLGRSWMSFEASVAPLLFVSGALALATGAGALIVLTGALGALFLYSQARILAADKGIPAWRHPRCLPLVVATGFAEGAGVLAARWPLLATKGFAAVASSVVALLLIRAFLWKRYLVGLRVDRAPGGSVQALNAIERRLVLLGHLVPAVLLAAAALVPAFGAALMIAGGLLSAYGGWMLKYSLIRRAAFSQGFVLKHLPVRGRAAAQTVGTGWSEAS